MPKRLLIERDPVGLIPWQKPEGVKGEAKVIIEGEMPEELKTPLVVDPRFINIKLKRHARDLPVRTSFVPQSVGLYALTPESGEFTPAVWSGYRSVLYCKDWANGAPLFKLKGLSFKNPLDMLPIYLNCDLAVCAGGRTLYELSALNIPIIGIASIEHEAKVIQAFNNLKKLEGFCLKWIEHEFVTIFEDTLSRLRRDRKRGACDE